MAPRPIRYVALLRGVDVGGKNPVPMAALKAFFEAEGLADVATYIQSGNVLFTSRDARGALVARLEAGLSKAFRDFSRLVAKASQSRMSRITALPIYRWMTIRSWSTTTRLLELMER